MSRALLKHRKIERAAIFVSEILTTFSSNEHDIFFFFIEYSSLKFLLPSPYQHYALPLKIKISTV